MPANHFDWSFLGRLRDILNENGQLSFEISFSEQRGELGLDAPDLNMNDMSIENINTHGFLDHWRSKAYIDEEKTMAIKIFTEIKAMLGMPSSETENNLNVIILILTY